MANWCDDERYTRVYVKSRGDSPQSDSEYVGLHDYFKSMKSDDNVQRMHWNEVEYYSIEYEVPYRNEVIAEMQLDLEAPADPIESTNVISHDNTLPNAQENEIKGVIVDENQLNSELNDALVKNNFMYT